jgi:hypothetical protein
MSTPNPPKSASIKASGQRIMTYTIPAAPADLGLEQGQGYIAMAQPPLDLELCRRIHAANMTLLNFVLLGSGGYADYMRIGEMLEDNQVVTKAQKRMIRALNEHFSELCKDFTFAFALEILRNEGWLAKMPGYEGESA